MRHENYEKRYRWCFASPKPLKDQTEEEPDDLTISKQSWPTENEAALALLRELERRHIQIWRMEEADWKQKFGGVKF
jgi:hypothetical protein